MWYIVIASIVFIQLTIEDHILHSKYGKEKHGLNNNASLALLWLPILAVLLLSLCINAKDS